MLEREPMRMRMDSMTRTVVISEVSLRVFEIIEVWSAGTGFWAFTG